MIPGGTDIRTPIGTAWIPTPNSSWRRRKTIRKAISGPLRTSARPTAMRTQPLDGIWARGPYLHGGSVPTMWDLLTPAEQRPKAFTRGGDIYDQKKLGFVHDVLQGSAQTGYTHLDGTPYTGTAFVLDTALIGNGNQGHTGPSTAPNSATATNGLSSSISNGRTVPGGDIRMYKLVLCHRIKAGGDVQLSFTTTGSECAALWYSSSNRRWVTTAMSRRMPRQG